MLVPVTCCPVLFSSYSGHSNNQGDKNTIWMLPGQNIGHPVCLQHSIESSLVFPIDNIESNQNFFLGFYGSVSQWIVLVFFWLVNYFQH